MSVETDIAEIKQTLVALDCKLTESNLHAKEMCTVKHRDIEQHLSESPRFRDMIIDVAGRVTLLTSVVLLLLVGILGIAYVVIQKIMGA